MMTLTEASRRNNVARYVQAGAKVARHRLTLTRRVLRQWARLQMRMQQHWENVRSAALTLRQKAGTAVQV